MSSPLGHSLMGLVFAVAAALAGCRESARAPVVLSSGTRVGATSAITRSADSVTLPDGDTVMVGSTTGSIAPEGRRGSVDALVARLASDGTVRWARQLGGPGFPVGLVVKAWSVAAGATDDIVVAGLVNGAPSLEGHELVATFSGFVASFAREDGELRWLSLLADASGPTELMGVSVLDDGTVLAAGYTATTSLHGATSLGAGDVVLVWFSPAGERLAVARFGGTDEEYPTAFVVRQDRAYFTRRSVDSSLGHVLGLELVVVGTDGEWIDSVEMSDPSSVEMTSLAVHPDGVCAAFVFRTFSETAGIGADYGLRCFDASLVPFGETRAGSPGVDARAADLACDETGRCALVGTVNGSFAGEPLGVAYAAFFARYSSSLELEVASHFGPEEEGETYFARGTSIGAGPGGMTLTGDVSGTLFGAPLGTVDTFVAPLDPP